MISDTERHAILAMTSPAAQRDRILRSHRQLLLALIAGEDARSQGMRDGGDREILRLFGLRALLPFLDQQEIETWCSLARRHAELCREYVRMQRS